GLGSHCHVARFDDKVSAMKVHRFEFGMAERFSYTTVPAGRAMNAIIQTPNERVEHSLHIDPLDGFGKASENWFPHICLAIAFGIFQIKNIWRGADKYAAA